MSLFVPDITGLSVVDAALAYAEAGWYVGPTSPANPKHPGSVLGKAWQTGTSRSAADIMAWFDPDYGGDADRGLFLHVGRSGAVAFDVDHPEALPKLLNIALMESRAPLASTRRAPEEWPEGLHPRGHRLFRVPDGLVIGNKIPEVLGKGWGEIRGLNGVIVVAPTLHPDRDDEENPGEYGWVRVGPVPPMSPTLRELFEAQGSPDEKAEVDVAEAGAWLDATLKPGTPTEAVRTALATFRAELVAGGRHEAMNRAVLNLVRLGERGAPGVKETLETVGREFFAAMGEDRDGGREEWRRGLVGAVATVKANPTPEPPAPRVWDLAPPPGSPRSLTESDEAGSEAGAGDWEAEFWAATPTLQRVYDFGMARFIPPWALLGCTLAWVLSYVEPEVVFDSTVATSAGSLNFYAALVSSSGGGKSSAMSAARELLDVPQQWWFDTVTPKKLASGEALAKAYMKPGKQGAPPEQVAWRAMVDYDEISTLGGQAKRQGSTLVGILNEAWTGGALGTLAMDSTRELPVPAGHYRLVLLAGVQPARAHFILDESGSGFAQRFVWFRAEEPGMEDRGLATPPSLGWKPPAQPPRGDRTFLTVCDALRQDSRAFAVRKARGEVEPLDAHANLARIKVAAGLAFLHGETKLSNQWWELAGRVMTHSKATRDGIIRVQRAEEAAARTARRLDVVETELAKAERLAESEDRRGIETAQRRILAALNRKSPQSTRALRKVIESKYRSYFETALLDLCERGLLIESLIEYRGVQGAEFRLA